MKAFNLAKHIINKTIELKKPISNLQLQKFLYFVHKDYLSETRQKLITDENFIATQHGIIIKSVYDKFRIYGAFLIEDVFDEENLLENLSWKKIKIINKIIENYSSLHPIKLNERIYIEGGIWDRVYKKGKGNEKIIFDSLIQKEAFNSKGGNLYESNRSSKVYH